MSRIASYAPLLALAAVLTTTSAQAATDFTVLAKEHSITVDHEGPSALGTGLDTLISLVSGTSFSVTASTTDLWSSGDLPRWSNANGQNALLKATGSDESLQPFDVTIGTDTVPYTFGGLTAHVGSLVGQIGSGSYFKIGTNYSGVAADTGNLKLFFWDSNSADNFNSVLATVSVSAVPEAETYAMMLAGLGVLGFMARRRRA